MDDTNKTCRAFLNDLSSASPTPGGGGAVGAALCGMVAHLTTGKKTYAPVENEIRQLLSTADALQTDLLAQVSADAEGFLPLSRAYALPKDDPSRTATLQAAAETACAAPLRIMELCVSALAAADRDAALFAPVVAVAPHPLEELVHRPFLAALSPCLRVVAVFAPQGAPLQKDDEADAGAVHRAESLQRVDVSDGVTELHGRYGR